VIRFNAFDMNCVAHQSPGLWKHPEDQSWRYKDLDYWTELARLLERGRFDGLFIADVLGTYDVYGAGDEAAIRQAAQIPVNDPMLLVSAMALVTEHLGFGVTTGTGFEHPYPFARFRLLKCFPEEVLIIHLLQLPVRQQHFFGTASRCNFFHYKLFRKSISFLEISTSTKTLILQNNRFYYLRMKQLLCLLTQPLI